MKHFPGRLALILTLILLFTGCSADIRADAENVNPSEEQRILPETSERRTLTLDRDETIELSSGEMAVFNLPAGVTAEPDIQPEGGLSAIPNGETVVLVAHQPGAHSVRLQLEDGDTRAIPVEIGEAESVDSNTEVIEQVGVGQSFSFSAKNLTHVYATSDTMRVRPVEDGRSLEVTLGEPGSWDLLLFEESGDVRRHHFEVLPHGVAPEGADVRELMVGGEPHKLDVEDVGRIMVSDDKIVNVSMIPEGTVALIQPQAEGLSLVTFVGTDGTSRREIWYRVQSGDQSTGESSTQ